MMFELSIVGIIAIAMVASQYFDWWHYEKLKCESGNFTKEIGKWGFNATCRGPRLLTGPCYPTCVYGGK